MSQVQAPLAAQPPVPRMLQWLKLLPGTGLSGVIALAATFVSTLHGGPQLLFALFFGVAFHFLSQDARAKPGIEFCARGVLRLGVGLLGARITATQIAGLGWTNADRHRGRGHHAAVRHAAGPAPGPDAPQGVLSGGAVAICGASAALAISSVLPRDKDSDRFTLTVVVTVTVLSTAAMVLYPLVARALHLPPELAGLFIGGTIHDVAQVVGAGYTIDQATGDYATIVKLFRVSMLAVVVVMVSALFKRQREAAAEQHHGKKPGLVPWFLWVFVALVAINSLGWVPPGLQHQLSDLSRNCLVLAIAALGLKTSFQQLAQAGWRPFALLVVETLWMAAFVLIAIEFEMR
ncbi:putative sulfate exporter family transporter [Delftia acidovorans]|nr:putative sulfate exporter family transporter [Delftia acidovorans]